MLPARKSVSRDLLFTAGGSKAKSLRKDMEKAIDEGEALINEMGESQLISLIRDKNFPAVRFWLTHRNPKFRERVEVTANFQGQEELSKEQKTVVREALRLASLGKKNEKVITIKIKSNVKRKNA